MLTSTGIGIITLAPVFVVGIAFVKMQPQYLLRLGLVGLASVSLLAFLFWTINILLDRWMNRRKSLVRKTWLRILLSFIFCLLLFHLIRIISVELLLNSPATMDIVKWKGEFFGLGDRAYIFLEYIRGVFPVTMLTLIVISINSVVIIIHRLIILNDARVRAESENLKLRLHNTEATNQILRQQMQPHFLFNSLTILRSLIRQQPEVAEQYIMNLSSFLRTSLSHTQTGIVKLTEEVAFTRDYLEMQKIRFGEAIQYSVDIKSDIMDCHIPVFALQILVENAIKHNTLTVQQPLIIRVFSQDDKVIVSNNLQLHREKSTSSGQGHANLTERYRLLKMEGIEIKEDSFSYSVEIKVLKDADSNH
jgi:hypothetical protein